MFVDMQFKILLVEDHKTVSESLRTLLEDNDYEVITCDDANLALKIIPKNDISLVITDIEMPKLNGIDFIKAIRKTAPTPVKILVLSTHSNDSLITQLFKLDVNGYINKSSSILDLLQAIRHILDGRFYFPDWVHKVERKAAVFDDSVEVSFTKRELDVLSHILNEKTTKEIAKLLNISISTVEEHRRNLLTKTGAKNVVGLVKYCIINQVL